MSAYSILQIKELCVMMFFGFIIGVLYELILFPTTIRKCNALRNILNTIYCIFTTSTFIFIVNYINLGKFQFFLLITYLLGIALERITLGNLFAKGFKNVYNLTMKSFYNFYKSKLGRIIFK